VRSHRGVGAAYWLIVMLLVAAQGAYTMAGLDRLWYEEVAESIRNPFWLDHRLVYDGVSSNVGWYGVVLALYKVFGFSTHAAKYFRLALHAVALICAAGLLRRCVGAARAWLPLAAFALSPTLLYFNGLATSYGLDLQLFPIVLSLLVFASDRHLSDRAAALLHVAVGAVVMTACLAFPSFLVYIPFLAAAAFWLNRSRARAGLAWTALGFAAPFAIAVVYLRNVGVFLADPSSDGAGVFRGGGNALTFDPQLMTQTMARLMGDLFFRGSTYYFAIPRAEFSGVVGLAAAAGIALGGVVLAWKWTPVRYPLALAALLCAASLAGVAVTQKLPGLRRATGFVSGFYVAVACAWAVPMLSGGVNRLVVVVAKLACLLLIVHHLVVYRVNYRYVASETSAMHDPWFSQAGPPDHSIAMWAHDWTLNGRPLDCRALGVCRYTEIYAAVAGYLKWNGHGEPPVPAIDPDSGRPITLSLQYHERRPVGQ
jgi:hypothetical protein